jgi:transcriptional regulator with XRE-family HTH domain
MKRETRPDVDQLAHHLRLWIQARRVTLQAVEKELGMGVGYLGQLLRGNLDLKVKHVLAVLEVIGVEPAEFFSSLYPPQAPRGNIPWPPRPDLGGPPERRTGEVMPELSDAELDQMMRLALRRMGVTAKLLREAEEPRSRRKKEKGRAS